MIQTSYGTITITDTTDIDKIENYYLATSHSSGVTTENGDWGNWTTTVQTMTSAKQYLQNYEKILGTGDVVINTTDPVIIGRYGQNGGTGAAGKGISSIVEYYNTTTTAVKPTSTTGFTTEVKQVDSTNKYLWNYEVINYTSGNPTTTDIRLIGVYGDPGNDAYTVILDNDSHVFSAGISAATATVITVKVIAYKGTTPIAANIGTITGQAAGLTTTLVNNKTTDAGFKITVTANLTTKSGVLTIPITVDGQSFTRKFSWSLALTGQTGTSVSSTIKYYQLATSKPQRPTNNEAISSDWTTTQPTFDQTKMEYTLYSVIQTVYSNGNITYSEVQIESSFEAAKIAYENSISALTSADGKNTIYHQTSQPSGGVYQDGDVWFDTNDGNKIYIWNASTSKWVATQFGVNAIADLAITNAKIANGTIQNAKIANLDAGKITTGDLDALRIKAHVISAVNSSTETSGGSSLKIAADKVEIDGTAIFNNTDFKTAADAAYDKKGSAGAVQTNLDNLSIGGRNLAQKNEWGKYKASKVNIGVWQNVEINGYKLNVTGNPDDLVGVRCRNITGNYVTFSYKTDLDTTTNYYTFKNDQLTTVQAQKSVSIVPENDKVVYTLQVPDDATVLDIGFGQYPYSNNYYVENLKVEIGNKATDWTPAPEDTDAAINTAIKSVAQNWFANCDTAAATADKVATIAPVTEIFTLKTGDTVNVKFKYTNSYSATASSPCTLNINGTGAKHIYYGGSATPTGTNTTAFGRADYTNTYVYDGEHWVWVSSSADNNTTYNLGQNQYSSAIKATNAITKQHIICGTSVGYKMLAASTEFDLSYPLLYTTVDIADEKTSTSTFLTYPGITYTTTGTITAGVANATIYLKGTVTGNTFKTTAAPFMTCTAPTSEDGYFYIPLGTMTSTTAGYFNSSRNLYAYIDGKFRQVTPTEIVASQRIYYRSYVAGTVSKPTAWITQTGNKYNDTVSVGNSGWSTKVTPIASSTAETAKKYLYLYACDQRKRLDGTVECTTVTLDENTTVIDGGNIITHSITATQIDADSINASKSLTVGAFQETSQNDILNSNIQVGGRNLLRHTKDFAESTYTSTCTFEKDAEDITVITFPAYTGTLGWKGCTFHPNIPYTLIRNKTVTLSFWYRSDSWTVVSGAHNYPLPSFEILATSTANPSGNDRLKYTTIYDATVPAPTTEWQQFVRTYNITDSFFTAGSGTVTADKYFTIQFFQHNLSQLQYKKFKLEIGNKATDWSPAPEDIDAELANKKSIHTLNTDYSYSYSKILTYSAEGYIGNWSVSSTTNVKIGDTVRLLVTVSNMDDAPVYIIGTVNTVKSATSLNVTSHGLDTTIIDGGNIITGTVTANQIAANAVTAEKIASHSISTNHLMVTDSTNLATASENIPNSLPGRVWNGTTYEEDGTSYANHYKLNINDDYLIKKLATQQYMMFTDFTPNSFRTGDELYYEFTAKAASETTVRAQAYGYTAPYTGSVCSNNNGKDITLTTTEQSFSGTIKLSAAKWDTDAKYYLLALNNNASTKVQIYVKKVIFRKKSAGELIVDGSITADKIDVNDLFAQNITATGTITGATIKGANGEFTKGFDVNILFDQAHGNIIADESDMDVEKEYIRQYFKAERDHFRMGFVDIWYDSEWKETVREFFDYYRNGAHPAMPTLDLKAFEITLTASNKAKIDCPTTNVTGSLTVDENAAVLGNKMIYEAGDVVDCAGVACAGSLTGSNKTVQFFIPLPKPSVDGSKATLSGKWTIRHADGGYILNNNTLQSIGTVTARVYELGIYVSIALSKASTFTNNCPVVVHGGENPRITFSA